MNEKIFVVPAEGRLVRDPITHEPLPGEGAEVPRDTHWLRRLRDGDVIEGTAPKQPTVQSRKEK